MKKLPKYLHLDGITVEIANEKEYNRLRRLGYTVPEHDPEVLLKTKKSKLKGGRPDVASDVSEEDTNG